MSQDRRFLLKFDTPPTHNERLTRFLGHYDLRIHVTDTAYFDLGAGSLGAFEHLSYVHQPEGFTGCLGSVGRWCEFGQGSTIIVRGDHDHDAPVNASLGSLRLFAPNAPDIGMKPFRPFTVGNGVVISAGARILSGLTIGDGAVIGAGAVVTRDVPAYSIVGGAPAKEIRQRTAGAAWWDWPADYLIANLQTIQEAASRPDGHPVRPVRPRFVLSRGQQAYAVTGFTGGDGVIHIREAPPHVLAHLAAVFAPEMREAYWLPDCWEE
ncbi:MAG TPA: hypothetical protein VN158_15280 [Caulobacter sp.]|nr:hypothetical protein [Caulobacter sp.]